MNMNIYDDDYDDDHDCQNTNDEPDCQNTKDVHDDVDDNDGDDLYGDYYDHAYEVQEGWKRQKVGDVVLVLLPLNSIL